MADLKYLNSVTEAGQRKLELTYLDAAYIQPLLEEELRRVEEALELKPELKVDSDIHIDHIANMKYLIAKFAVIDAFKPHRR